MPARTLMIIEDIN